MSAFSFPLPETSVKSGHDVGIFVVITITERKRLIPRRILMGFAYIADGLVQIFSFGFLTSWIALDASAYFLRRDVKRHKAQKKVQNPFDN